MAEHRGPRAMHREVVSTILAHLAEGKSRPQAAVKAGIHPQTMQAWVRAGNAERSRLEMLGIDTEAIDDDDPRINNEVRRQFAFSRAVVQAEQLPGAEILATLYQAATEGIEEVRVSEQVIRNEEGELVVVGRHETRTRRVDLQSARWLAERLDERMHLPTSIHLSGPGGQPLEIAGMTETQAEALAVFVRTLLATLLEVAPARTRVKLEERVPEALEAAMAAISPPRQEEPVS